MCRSYASAIRDRRGHARRQQQRDFARHIGAAQRRDVRMSDGWHSLWVMEKERHDSPNKIDLAMAGGLSWQARLDSLAKGEGASQPSYAYVF